MPHRSMCHSEQAHTLRRAGLPPEKLSLRGSPQRRVERGTGPPGRMGAALPSMEAGREDSQAVQGPGRKLPSSPGKSRASVLPRALPLARDGSCRGWGDVCHPC